MSKKQIMKKVFDKEFNINAMRIQILEEMEKKEKMMKVLKYALPLCVILIISGILIWNNSDNKMLKFNTKDEEKYSNIRINKISALGAAMLDADVKTVLPDEIDISWLDLNDSLPSDLDKFDGYKILTRKDRASAYDILNCYVYEYYNEDSLRSIRIAFSDKNKPIRDYYFDIEKVKKSKINETELMVYQYEELFFTEFVYRGYNFDIETSNISLEELTSLLETIIK